MMCPVLTSPVLVDGSRYIRVGVVRPILLWGAPVWYTGVAQATILKRLQSVMDASARFLLGVFKGASAPALRFFSSLMPLSAYLPKLKAFAAYRRLTLPNPPRRKFTSDGPKSRFSKSFTDPFPRLPAETLPRSVCPPWSSMNSPSPRMVFHLPGNAKEERKAAVANINATAYPSSPDILSVFTDGSATLLPNLRYLTGWSWVAYSVGTEALHAQGNVGPYAHSTDLEMTALLQLSSAITKTPDLARYLRRARVLNIYTDCLPALSMLQVPTQSPGLHTILEARARFLGALTRFPRLTIHFHWCPGHENIVGNERADELARDAARGDPDHELNPTLCYLRSFASHRALQLWRGQHRAWEPTTRLGRMAKRACVGEVSHRPHPLLRLPAPRWVKARAAQLLTSCGRFGDYFHKRHIVGPSYRCRHCPLHFPPLETRTHILLDCAATIDIRSKAWDGDPPSDEEAWLHPDNCDRLLWFIANSRPLALTAAIENELTADLPDPGPPKHRDRPNPALVVARNQIREEFLAEGRALEGPFFDQAFFTARVHTIYWAHGPL
ncbi:hypothetical protein ACEPAI_447 [Sanghuangporus weigelae]